MPLERETRGKSRAYLLDKRPRYTGFRQSHAFVVGVNQYPLLKQPLLSAVPDAWRFAHTLWSQQGFTHVWLWLNPHKQSIDNLFTWLRTHPNTLNPDLLPVWKEVVEEGQASLLQAQIRNELWRIGNEDRLIHFHQNQPFDGIRPQAPEGTAAEEDSLVFYYAGHGQAGQFDQGPAGFLFPMDVTDSATMDKRLPMEEVLDVLSTLNCKHTLLVLDCCFAGKFRHIAQGTRLTELSERRPITADRFERFKRKKAWQVLVSAGPSETAADWMNKREDQILTSSLRLPHSPFAMGLFEALEGRADYRQMGDKFGDGVLTANELKAYLFDRVQRSTFLDPAFQEQHPDLFPMKDHDGGEFIFINPVHPVLNFAKYQHLNPYKGLLPFEQTDWPFFFGRSSALADIEKRDQTQLPILLITAPSGQGKSSLVKAGVMPRKEKEGFATYVVRPGEQPWTGEKVISGQGDAQQVYWSGLADLLDEIEAAGEGTKHFILLDQYEEFLHYQEANRENTFSETEDFEDALTEILEGVFNEGKQQVQVMITMRSDYEWQFDQTNFGKAFHHYAKGVLKENAHQYRYRLAAMTLDELREALVSPAFIRGYDFESEELENEILEEIGYAPAALSLLSFTMNALFALTEQEIRESGVDERIFTRSLYQGEKLGGVSGSLSTRAQLVYDGLTEPQQKTFQKLFLRMVQVNEGGFSRRRIYFPSEQEEDFLFELNYPGEETDALAGAAVEAYSQAQLLVIGRFGQDQAFMEPAHDALINHWPQSREWIAAFGRDNLLLQRQLWQAVLDRVDFEDQMQQNQFRNDIRGEVIQAFQAPDVSQFWDNNPKLLQIINLLAETTLPLIQGVSGPESPAGKAFHALPDGNGFQKESFLITSHVTQQIPDLDTLIQSGITNQLLEVYLLHGDHWLNEAEVEFVRESWRVRTARITQLKEERDRAISDSFAFRAQMETDRSRAFKLAELSARVQMDNPLAYQELANAYYFHQGPLHDNLLGHGAGVNAVAFSRSTQWLASGSADYTVRFWEVSTRRELPPLDQSSQAKHTQSVELLAFYTFTTQTNQEKELLLSAGHDNQLILWDFLNGDNYKCTSPLINAHPTAIAVSPDNTQFVLGLENGALLTGTLGEPSATWTSLKTLIEFGTHRIRSLCYTETGKYLVVAKETSESDQNGLVVMRMAQAKPVPIAYAATKEAILRAAVFEEQPNLLKIILCNTGHTVWLAEIPLPAENSLVSTPTEIPHAELNPIIQNPFQAKGELRGMSVYGKQVVLAGGLDYAQLKVIDLHDVSVPKEVAMMHVHTTYINAILHAPNGLMLASVSQDRSIKLWDFSSWGGGTGGNNWAFQSDPKVRTRLYPGGEVYKMAYALEAHKLFSVKKNRRGVFHQWTLPQTPTPTHDWAAFLQADPSIFQLEINEPTGQMVSALEYHSDQQTLVTGSKNGDIYLWDCQTSPPTQLKGFSQGVEVVALQFFNQGNGVISGGSDGSIRIWDKKQKQPLFTLVQNDEAKQVHTDFITDLVVSEKHQTLIASSWDRRISCWNLTTGAWINTLSPAIEEPVSLAINPDEEELSVGGVGFIRTYFLVEGVPHEKKNLVSVFTLNQSASELCYNTGGTRLIAFGQGIKIWDTITRQALISLKGEADELFANAHYFEKENMMLGTTFRRTYPIELSPETVIQQARAIRRFGTLTPDEITRFNLEPDLVKLGFMKEGEDLSPLIESGEEDQMFNLALYFFEQGRLKDPVQRREMHTLSKALLEGAKKIGFLHPPETYNAWLSALDFSQ